MISRVKALAPAIQQNGAALLLDGHVELVARAGADGAHLTGIEAMQEALPTLKPDALPRRRTDDAARFDGRGRSRRRLRAVGEPDAKGSGRRWKRSPSACNVGRTVRASLCRFAASREEAYEFAAAGADFVLVGDFIWTDPRGAAAALLDAEQTIRQAALQRPE